MRKHRRLYAAALILKKMAQEIARSALDSLEDKFASYEQVGHRAFWRGRGEFEEINSLTGFKFVGEP